MRLELRERTHWSGNWKLAVSWELGVETMKGKDKESAARKAKDLVLVAERAHKEAARKADAADEVSKQAKSALKKAKKDFKAASKAAREARDVADEARCGVRQGGQAISQSRRQAWQGPEESGRRRRRRQRRKAADKPVVAKAAAAKPAARTKHGASRRLRRRVRRP